MTPNYLALPDPEAAELISTLVKRWDEEEQTRYATLGLMVLAVHKRMLWQHVLDPEDGFPCRSLARWIRLCAPKGYSTCYAAMRDCEELSDVPAVDLAQIPQSNFATMKQLSTAVRRDPAVLKAAKGKTEGLVAHVKKTHPDQHLSHTAPFRLTPTDEQRAEIEEAVELAIQCGDATSKEEAIFMWAVSYRQECQERDAKDMSEYEGRVQ
jgi:hypothetical protein